MKEKDKALSNPIWYVFILLGIIVLSCAGHLNFFLKDARPFLDHDWHYFDIGYFKGFELVYDLLINVLPASWQHGIVVYKMLNLLYLIPLIIFTCLSVSYMYGRALGLVSAFFIATTPAVLNVFHQSDINLQTVTILSFLLYIYLRTDFFRSFFFSVLFALTLFLFYSHHYSSVFFLGAFFPSLLLGLFIQFRQKTVSVRNILVVSFLFFLFLVIDMALNQDRYILFINVLDNYYMNPHEYELGKFVSAASYICQNIRDNLISVIMQGAKYFNFHAVFSLVLLLTNIVYLFVLGIKKNKLHGNYLVEAQLVLFVLSFFVMFAFDRERPIDIFFAPMFVILTVLNAGAVVKLFSWFKNRCFLQSVSFCAFFLFFIYGLILLFAPNLFFFQKEAEVYCYAPVEDDFNLKTHVDFFALNGISPSEIVVIGEGNPLDYVPDLYFFSLWVAAQKSIEGVRVRDIKSQSAYLVYLYDISEKEEKADSEYLISLSNNIALRIAKKYKIKKQNILSLVNVMPFGVLSEADDFSEKSFCLSPDYGRKYRSQQKNIFFNRRYLSFVFYIKDVRGLSLRRFL